MIIDVTKFGRSLTLVDIYFSKFGKGILFVLCSAHMVSVEIFGTKV